MRVAMLLMAAAILMLLMGAVVARANVSDSTAWEAVELEAAGDRAVAGDLAVSDGQAQEAMFAVGTAQEGALPTFRPAGEELVRRMADGFLKKTRGESKRWWGCGEETPESDQPERAERIARNVLAAMREFDLHWLSHWAVIGTIWKESRGDPCAIGPNSRKAAKKLGLVPDDRIFNRWSAEEVKALLENPKWKKSRSVIGADLGLGQEVWQRYARILDPNGNKSCGKGLACRVPTLDEILSYEHGPRVVATGMVYRRHLYREMQPWLHWPGNVRDLSYGMRIERIVQEMGGDIREKPVW